MKRIFGLVFLAGAAALIASRAVVAAPQIVFQRSLSVDRSTNIFTTSKFDLKFVLGDSFFTPTNPVTLFDGTSITPADVGKVYTVDANSPGFAAVAGRLTDSHNEFIQLLMTESSSGRAEKRGWNERGFFTGVATSTSPDLAGLPITAFTLSIDSFTLTPPASAEASSQALLAGPPVALNMTFAVYGVPEPATVILLFAGLPAVAGLRYTARKRRTVIQERN